MISFLRRYWRWVLLLAFTNWLIWIGFEHVHSKELGYEDLWPIRMYLGSGLLLFDNLCVLWWYADSTRRQLELSSKEYLERNKPVVFLDRIEDPDKTGHRHYAARNAGGGYAVNVYYYDVSVVNAVAVGSLASGEHRVLPRKLDEYLCKGGAIKSLIVAEAPYTRTTQWIATLNLRTQEGGDHEGQVLHRPALVTTEPPRFQYQSLQEYMKTNANDFRKQLRELEADKLAAPLLESRE